MAEETAAPKRRGRKPAAKPVADEVAVEETGTVEAPVEESPAEDSANEDKTESDAPAKEESEAEPRHSVKVLKEGDPIEFEHSKENNQIIALQEVVRERSIPGTKRTTFMLVVGKGCTFPANQYGQKV